MSEPDLVERLRRLADLHASGALSAEEFAQAKAALLARSTTPAVEARPAAAAFAETAEREAARAAAALSRAQSWAASRELRPERLTAGDWRGAVIAVGAGLGSMLAFYVLLLFLSALVFGRLPADASELGVPLLAILTALAAGGSVTISGEGFGQAANAASSVMPLNVTLIGFGVLGFVFLRRLREPGTATPVDALLQAVRTWLVLLVGLLVVALVGRASGPAFGPVDLRIAVGIGSTLFWGTVLLAGTLAALLAWRRPDLLPERVRDWRDGMAGPVAGVATTVLLFMVLALLAQLITFVAISQEGAGTLSFAPVLLGVNVALAGFGIAVGVPAEAVVPQVGLESSGLLRLVELDARFWLLPLVAALLLLAGGVVAALHAPSPDEARRASWRMGPALAVFLLAVSILTAVSVQADGFGGSVTLTFGMGAFAAVLLGLLWGAVAGLLGSIVAPRLPIVTQTSLRARIERTRAARAIGGAGIGPPRTAGPPHPAGPVPPVDRPPDPQGPVGPPAAAAATEWAAQPPGGPSGATTTPDGAALVRRLRELTDQHKAGTISAEEFAAAKATLLGSG